MAEETHTEQIKELALKEICPRPKRGQRLDSGIISAELYFQANKLLTPVREQLIGKFEAWLTRIKVSAGEIRKKIHYIPRLELVYGFADELTPDVDGHLI